MPDATPDPSHNVSSGLARFASDEASAVRSGGNDAKGYGLQVRGANAEGDRDASKSEGGVPQGRHPDASQAAMSRERRDASPPLGSRHPAASSAAAYSEMPIEGFGRALFAGMGWVEGQAMGRRKGADVVAKVPGRRPALLGLGANETKQDAKATASAPSERTNGSGSAARGSKDSGEAVRPTGRDEKASARGDGDHNRSRPSSSSSRHEDFGSSSRAPRDAVRQLSSCGRDSASRSPPPPRARRPVSPSRSWLAPGIRVRVVSGSLAARALPKATVLDVPRPGIGMLRLDPAGEGEGRPSTDSRARHLTVHQDDLETIVPRHEGARVGVVVGEFKGQAGSLLQRDARAGVAHVLLDGEGAVERIPLDHVAHLEDEAAFLGRGG